ncbi:hypothetical protein AgCh_017643 [Apium graveolens]
MLQIAARDTIGLLDTEGDWVDPEIAAIVEDDEPDTTSHFIWKTKELLEKVENSRVVDGEIWYQQNLRFVVGIKIYDGGFSPEKSAECGGCDELGPRLLRDFTDNASSCARITFRYSYLPLITNEGIVTVHPKCQTRPCPPNEDNPPDSRTVDPKLLGAKCRMTPKFSNEDTR